MTDLLLSLAVTLDILFLIQVPRSAAIFSKLACKRFDDGSALAPAYHYQGPCVEQLDGGDWGLGVAFYPVSAPRPPPRPVGGA